MGDLKTTCQIRNFLPTHVHIIKLYHQLINWAVKTCKSVSRSTQDNSQLVSINNGSFYNTSLFSGSTDDITYGLHHGKKKKGPGTKNN